MRRRHGKRRRSCVSVKREQIQAKAREQRERKRQMKEGRADKRRAHLTRFARQEQEEKLEQQRVDREKRPRESRRPSRSSVSWCATLRTCRSKSSPCLIRSASSDTDEHRAHTSRQSGSALDDSRPAIPDQCRASCCQRKATADTRRTYVRHACRSRAGLASNGKSLCSTPSCSARACCDGTQGKADDGCHRQGAWPIRRYRTARRSYGKRLTTGCSLNRNVLGKG